VNGLLQLSFLRANGNVKFLLYSDPFRRGPSGYGVVGNNDETISLVGLAAGTYYIRVYGYAANSYSLQVTP
jgi:hypothetical protein